MREASLYRKGDKLYYNSAGGRCYIQEVVTEDADVYINVVYVSPYVAEEIVVLETDSFITALDKLEEIST